MVGYEGGLFLLWDCRIRCTVDNLGQFMKPAPVSMSQSTKVTRDRWFAKLPWIDQEGANIDDYCRTHQEPLFDLKDKLTHWRDQGVVIFERAISPVAIDAFLGEMDSLISAPQGFSLEMDIAGKRKPISEFTTEELRSYDKLKFNNVHYISPAARLLSLSPVVVNFLRHVFQETPCAMQTLTFNKGSQQPAHADFAFVHNQTNISFMAASWIPLEDIHPDSGPLAYYPGTHKVMNFGFYDFGDGEIILTNGSDLMSASEFAAWLQGEITAGKYPQKIFLPKKGDVLLWHAALVHEGSRIINQSLTRKSLVTHYTGRSQMPETHIMRDADGAVQQIEHNGGVVLKHRWVDYGRQL